jgi:hypothetical protein
MPAVLSKPLYFRSKYTGFQNEIHTDKQGKLNVHWWIKYGSVIIDPTPCAYDFAPSYMKGRKLYWRNQQCKQAAFHGNEPLPGAHDAHQYHAVVIRAGMLYCSNLVDEEGERFGADAKQLLPLTGASKDGQFRICGNKPLAYLTSISRVFRLVKEPVSARGKRGKAAGRKQRQKAKKKQKTANAA